jgi:hypothetical protein
MKSAEKLRIARMRGNSLAFALSLIRAVGIRLNRCKFL